MTLRQQRLKHIQRALDDLEWAIQACAPCDGEYLLFLEFKAQLQRQFGIIDAEVEIR